MTRRALTCMLFLLASFVLVVAAPSPWTGSAYAQDESGGEGGSSASEDEAPEPSPSTAERKTVDAEGNTKNCEDVPEAKGGVMLGAIVPCLAYTIESAAVKFTAEMVSWLQPLLYTFMTLVVVLFGIRILQQEPNIHKQGLLLLLKITLVVAFLNMLPSFVPKVYDIMNESQSIVMGTIDSSSLHCEVDKYSGDQTPKVWATLDCVAGKLFGFSMGEAASSDSSGSAGSGGGTGSSDGSSGSGESSGKKPSMLLVTSMFGLLAGFFFGGAWGVVVFFMMLGVLISIFTLITRVVMAFLSGYLVACLVLIIAPLIVPLVFLNATKAYVEAIWKNLLGAFLMPIIIVSYTMFALLIYDKMLFAPDSIVQKLFKYEHIKEALENPRKVCDKPVTNKADEIRFGSKANLTQFNELIGKNPFLQNFIMPALTAGNDPCALAKVTNLNVKKMSGEEFKKGRETYVKLFQELLQLFILAFLIQEGLRLVTGLIGNLTGAGTVSMALSAQTQMDFKFKEGVDAAKQSMMRQFGMKDGEHAKGADMVERMPVAAREGLKDFMSILTHRK